MKVHFITDPTNGCGFVRAVLPAAALSELGHDVSMIDGNKGFSVPEDTDAIILGRIVTGDYMGTLLNLRRQGVKVVYDLDDAMDLVEPTNAVYSFAISNLESYFFLLGQCDLVTVTTEDLKNHLRQFVPPSTEIAVLPNCVAPSRWKMRQGGNKIPHIGFAGSNSHLRDVLPVLEALRRLQMEPIKFDFTLFGFSSSHENFETYYADNMKAVARFPKGIFAENLGNVQKALSRIEYRWEKAVPIDKYAHRLADLNFDLGICAVRESDFNRYKSSLKAYEYGMVGTEVMCSEEKPYTDDMRGLVDFSPHTADGWYASIKDWLTHWVPDRALKETSPLKEWILEERNIHTASKLYEEAFRSVVGQDISRENA